MTQPTYRSHNPCSCVYDREFSDAAFLKIVDAYVSILINYGWRIFVYTDKHWIPRVEIFEPGQCYYDDGCELTYEEELACEYFGE